jgi:choline dehydrogenase
VKSGVPSETFDYVIVGAGSAGCVLANRLTASGKHRVLLLEAGGHDRRLWIHIPLGYGKLFADKRVNWLYTSEPEPELNNRPIIQPRGKVLGGSSSINGLLYIRGQHADFDHWRQLGNSGFNGRTQEGAGYFQLTAKNGRRCSTAVGYLRQARQRPNIAIATDALATRILFSGRRAIGVQYRQNGATHIAHANAEVILAGGAFNSPQLLQLSGVGPAALLQGFGIPVIADMPGVGAELQDHLQVRMQFRCSEPITMNDVINSWRRRMAAGLRYCVSRKGLLAIGAGYAGGFFRTGPQVATPDVQVHFIIFSADSVGAALHPFPGFIASVCQLRPQSRGFVRIKSVDPPLHRPGACAGARMHQRCGLARLCARHRRHLISPHQHLPHGCRCDRGCRRAAAGARHRTPARGRRLDHANARFRQHQCGDRDDRRERRGHDPAGRTSNRACRHRRVKS